MTSRSMLEVQAVPGWSAVFLGLCALLSSPCAGASASAVEKVRSVAVMPLQAKGVAANEADVMTDALVSQLQRSEGQRVMERSQMDQIMREQGFEKSGACDGSECAVQMGRLLSVDHIVVGAVGLVGHTYTLSLRMVNVGTGEVLRSSMKSRAGTIDDVLTKLVPETVSDLTSTGESKTAGAGADSNSHWGWWLAGGAVVVGGAAAAAVLLTSGSSGSGSSGSGSGTTAATSLTATW